MPTLEHLKLVRLTLSEARWLHANRHLEIAHEIVRAKNLVVMAPLDPSARMGWNNTLEAWRKSPEHPAFDQEEDE